MTPPLLIKLCKRPFGTTSLDDAAQTLKMSIHDLGGQRGPRPGTGKYPDAAKCPGVAHVAIFPKVAHVAIIIASGIEIAIPLNEKFAQSSSVHCIAAEYPHQLCGVASIAACSAGYHDPTRSHPTAG